MSQSPRSETAAEEPTSADPGPHRGARRTARRCTPVVTHRWAGIWGETADRLPLVGRRARTRRGLDRRRLLRPRQCARPRVRRPCRPCPARRDARRTAALRPGASLRQLIRGLSRRDWIYATVCGCWPVAPLSAVSRTAASRPFVSRRSRSASTRITVRAKNGVCDTWKTKLRSSSCTRSQSVVGSRGRASRCPFEHAELAEDPTRADILELPPARGERHRPFAHDVEAVPGSPALKITSPAANRSDVSAFLKMLIVVFSTAARRYRFAAPHSSADPKSTPGCYESVTSLGRA